MAESEKGAECTATLEIPPQPQPKNDEQNVSLLGQSLEALLDAVKRKQEEIGVKVDVGSCTEVEYREHIRLLNNSRLAIYKTRDKWIQRSGHDLEDNVHVAIANCEHATAHLVIEMQHRLKSLEEDPIQKPVTMDVAAVRALANEPADHQPSYGAELAAVVPRKVARKKSSRASKTSRKTSSTTAAKLWLATEAAEIRVNEQFDEELCDRTRRQIVRDAKRATRKPVGRRKTLRGRGNA